MNKISYISIRIYEILIIFLLSGLCIADDQNDIAMPQTAIINASKTFVVENTGRDLCTMAVDSAQIIEVKGEKLQLSIQKPDSWKTGTKLSQIQTLGPGKGITAIGSVDPNSIVVRFNGMMLRRGQDYLLDTSWGVLGIGTQPRVTIDDVVEVDYRYSLRRVDSYVVDANGNHSVVKGVSDLTVPQPPILAASQKRVANIFVDYFSDGKTAEVFPITQLHDKTQTTISRIPKTLAKLQAGQEVKIVCWGDSVTEGGDASSPEKFYPAVFEQKLKEKFPKALIKVTTVAVGGSSSRQWLYPDEFKAPSRPEDCRWDRVVQGSPDLVTIEFVNDAGFTAAEFERAYVDILKRCKIVGAEVIFITPHFTLPSWMGFSGLKEDENRPYVKMLKQFADIQKVAIADVSTRWENLHKHGIPYVTLLKNGVNHPDDRGHLIFAEELVKCFE
jgi:lysophospholipase L1-like esterase